MVSPSRSVFTYFAETISPEHRASSARSFLSDSAVPPFISPNRPASTVNEVPCGTPTQPSSASSERSHPRLRVEFPPRKRLKLSPSGCILQLGLSRMLFFGSNGRFKDATCPAALLRGIVQNTLRHQDSGTGSGESVARLPCCVIAGVACSSH